ncbi:NUDIX hydrolase [Sphingobacterium corticibacter]|uniref:GDP-mannose pyrophosphatase n=1 Tax=Sphingobacterium corticibacter TaxID=2171749 RepID=A0A2T8HK78_9SPHI|nr:NUDIX hydrolase [Sphingobacterium corticibacter]PVH25790.1 DNA mismatch repair protein MutT [Sphingobacterium corticibacter]
MTEPWKILQSEYIIKRPWATLRVDQVQLPNGLVKDEYYILEYPKWVNMVGFTEDNEIVFVRQYRHGAEKVLLELPAGVVEDGEEPEVAARREMMEETGYAFDEVTEICQLYANPATSGNLTYTYVMKGGRKVAEQELDDSEDIEVVILSIEEAKKMLLENGVGQALHTSALFYVLHHEGLF